MIEYYWTCKVCGIQTTNEEEKLIHLKKAKKDPIHQLKKHQKEYRNHIYYPQLEIIPYEKNEMKCYCQSPKSLENANPN